MPLPALPCQPRFARAANAGRSALERAFLGALLGALVATPAAQAVPVAPGDSVFLPGTTLADRPDLAGVDLQNDPLLLRVGHPFWPEGMAAGWSVRQQVLRSDVTGALVFSTQLIWSYNITLGDFLVDAIWLDGWGNAVTDVDYRTDLSGDRGPSFATRTDDGQRLDLGFGFPLFSGNLTGEPHEDSMPIVVATSATAFANSGAFTVVGRFSDRPGEVFVGRVDGLAVPVASPVPEPAGWALMTLGTLALALRQRRGRVVSLGQRRLRAE
jgi:hypothetical protein